MMVFHRLRPSWCKEEACQVAPKGLPLFAAPDQSTPHLPYPATWRKAPIHLSPRTSSPLQFFCLPKLIEGHHAVDFMKTQKVCGSFAILTRMLLLCPRQTPCVQQHPPLLSSSTRQAPRTLTEAHTSRFSSVFRGTPENVGRQGLQQASGSIYWQAAGRGECCNTSFKPSIERFVHFCAHAWAQDANGARAHILPGARYIAPCGTDHHDPRFQGTD